MRLGAERIRFLLVGSIVWAKWTEIAVAAAVCGAVGVFHYVFRDRFELATVLTAVLATVSLSADGSFPRVVAVNSKSLTSIHGCRRPSTPSVWTPGQPREGRAPASRDSVPRAPPRFCGGPCRTRSTPRARVFGDRPM